MADTDLAFAGVARLGELLAAGEVSSRELVELFLERIARHDSRLNAFRTVFAEEALAAADAADARRRDGESGPLLGMPIAVKDDMDVAGEVTAMGSIAHTRPAAEDAAIVRSLREAGAVIVGKTNVPELMTMPFTETVWYGATRNPWDLDRTPGGSSGGSAAAVAAGLVPAATASDGAGSIRIPAACTSLVGLKPRPGAVPTPPHWGGMSTYGFVARTVADSALLYDAVKTPPESWAEAAGRDPGTLRIAWSVALAPGARRKPDETQRAAVDSAADTLAELGHRVEPRDPSYGLAGIKTVVRYLAGVAESVADTPNAERLDRRTRGLARLGRAIPGGLARRAQAAAATDRDRIARIFEHADVLVLPLFTELPPRIGDYEGLGGLRSLDKALGYTPWPGLFNHTGLPAIAVPTERMHDGFPLAVQLVGPPDSEARLLGLAAQLEAAVGWPARRPPGFDS